MMPFSMGLASNSTTFMGIKTDNRGMYLYNLLKSCARCVVSGNLENATIGLEQISQHVSPDGDKVERMVAYFTQALADRVLKAWRPGLYKALNATKITSASEVVAARKIYFEFFPFLRLAYVITNQTILEAMGGEKVIHIIDLHCSEPAQWINFLNELRLRPEGPPYVRITGIHEQKEVLDQMSRKLIQAAEKLDIPFQFHPIISKLENLDIGDLRVKTGEAIGICSVLQLHSLLACDGDRLPSNSSDFSNNARLVQLKIALQMKSQKLGYIREKDVISINDSNITKAMKFLNALCDLSPKIMVITEQESNHNTNGLIERLDEAIRYYATLFDCLQNTIPKATMERQKLEKMMFGEEIKNIIACEGIERKSRHEKLEKWIPRLELSGFGRIQLSYNAMRLARRVLLAGKYDGFEIKQVNGCFFLCWLENPLFSVSAWRFTRHK